MELFRTPDERFEGLPGYAFEPHYEEVDGLRLHYVDEGTGDPVVCFHGEPSWAFEYRELIPALVAAGRRVVCPDLAGFGRSDKPTDRGWYSFDRHYDLMQALLTALELSDVMVVAQDWGGPIGLRWVVEHPAQVERLALFNTSPFTGRVAPGFLEWRAWATGHDALPVGEAIQRYTTTEVPPSVLAGYEAPFPTPESKAGPSQFPNLVPTEETAPMAVTMKGVVEKLTHWERPTLVLFSDADSIFPSARLAPLFRDLIPGAGEPVILEGAEHFVAEDAGARLVDELARFARR